MQYYQFTAGVSLCSKGDTEVVFIIAELNLRPTTPLHQLLQEPAGILNAFFGTDSCLKLASIVWAS